MKQQSLSQSARRTRRCEFLGEMERWCRTCRKTGACAKTVAGYGQMASRPEAQRQSDQDLANLFTLLVQKWLSA